VPEPKPRRDETLIKAIVRAHRWRRSIESGQARSITDVAEQEGVTDAYVCRLLPLTCLAPDIVEATWTGGSRRLRPKCGLVLVGVLVRDAERPLDRVGHWLGRFDRRSGASSFASGRAAGNAGCSTVASGRRALAGA
jgi:hypothetical protein